MRIAINGFGRIGRLALRAAFGGTAIPAWPDADGLSIVHINEPGGGAEALAHLTEFDSVHGRWSGAPEPQGNALRLAGQRISLSQETKIEAVPWADHGVDLVIEASGKFTKMAQLQAYLKAGVKAVVVAAPVKDGALNIVMGINDDLYDPDKHPIVTAASCTTNCLAPMVKVVHEGIGIRHGSITTLHDVTNTQVMVDKPHKDLRRARSGLTSLIPTTTGSATAIGLIYPELQGRLNGHAVRVPLLNASITDAVFEVARETSVEEVNNLFKAAAEGPLHGILGYETRPLVSVDYRSDPRSSILDAPSTMVVNGTQVKLYTWYDNEMGYACRLSELVAKVAGALRQRAAA